MREIVCQNSEICLIFSYLYEKNLKLEEKFHKYQGLIVWNYALELCILFCTTQMWSEFFIRKFCSIDRCLYEWWQSAVAAQRCSILGNFYFAGISAKNFDGHLFEKLAFVTEPNIIVMQDFCLKSIIILSRFTQKMIFT